MKRQHLASMVALILTLPTLALASPTAKETRAPSPEAAQAFTRLQQRYGNAQVLWQTGLAGPQLIVGLQAHPKGDSDRARAERFIHDWRELLGVGPRQLRFVEIERSKLRITVRFMQVFRGVEVLDRYLVVVFDKTGELLSLSSDALSISKVSEGKISERDAQAIAVRTVFGISADQPTPKAKIASRQVIFASPGLARLAWRIVVVRSALREHMEVIVDATTGKILQIRDLVRHG